MDFNEKPFPASPQRPAFPGNGMTKWETIEEAIHLSKKNRKNILENSSLEEEPSCGLSGTMQD